MRTEEAKKADAKYKRKNTKRFTVHLNKKYDQDMIDFLESCENVSALLKKLVDEEMKKALKA